MLGKREGGVCARSYSLCVRKSAVCTCCALYRKCENSLCGVSGLSFVFAGLSLFPASHFVVWVSPLLFAFPSSTALVTVHRTHECGSVGTCNLSVSRDWDGHGRSVG